MPAALPRMSQRAISTPDFVNGWPATARRIFIVSRSISRGSSPISAGSRNDANHVRCGNEVFAAPDRRAGDFAQSGDAFIRVDLQDEERRLRCDPRLPRI